MQLPVIARCYWVKMQGTIAYHPHRCVHLVSYCVLYGRPMAESGEQGREEEEVAEISGGSVWSASTTRMLISYYKENPILWDKRLKENGNKTKTKKAMAPLIARFEKANPPRSAQDLKAKWHSLRSSVLRYLKKQKEEEDIEIKWPFWEDLNFLRASLQNSDEDNLVWTAEEIGNPFSYSD